MATLAPPQVYALARQTGFSPAGAFKMVGIVATESGGRTDAAEAGGHGRGLVQIDLGQHPDVTEAQAFDPHFAMRWAFDHSGAGSPAKLGAPLFYGPRDHPAAAAAAIADASRSNPEGKAAGAGGKSAWETLADYTGVSSVVDLAGGVSGPVDTAAQVGDFVVTVGRGALWVVDPHNWGRVAEVLLGAALVMAGLWHLSPAASGAVKAAAGKAALLVAV